MAMLVWGLCTGEAMVNYDNVYKIENGPR